MSSAPWVATLVAYSCKSGHVGQSGIPKPSAVSAVGLLLALHLAIYQWSIRNKSVVSIIIRSAAAAILFRSSWSTSAFPGGVSSKSRPNKTPVALGQRGGSPRAGVTSRNASWPKNRDYASGHCDGSMVFRWGIREDEHPLEE